MAPGSTERRPAIAIAVTGASGAIYATRTIAALLERGVHVELIVTDYGRRLLRDELGDAASVEGLRPFLIDKYGPAVDAGTMNLHSNRDLGATIASGSHGCSGMAIVPCSMKTLAAVAHGLSRSLVERAADVMLKEKRRLVIVALLLVYEQSLVRADDLSQVKRAFDLNGYVGILYLLVLAVSIYGA